MAGGNVWKRSLRSLLATLAAASILLPAALAADKTPAKPVSEHRSRLAPNAAADEEVVAAMQRGVDYLLEELKGDNWEEGTNWPKSGQHGGVTSIVLYALLHTGQSLDDPRLTFRSKELAPVIDWLTKQDIEETYSAALASAALAMIPNRSDEVTGAMERLQVFHVLGMGETGGYAYRPENDFEHIKAKMDATKRLAEIRKEALQARAKGDNNRLKELEGQFNAAQEEIAKADKALAKSKPLGKQLQDSLVSARKKLATAMQEMKTGGTKEVGKKDKDGKQLKDKDNKDIKERVPKTPEDLRKQLEEAKTQVEQAERAAQLAFRPIGDLSNGQYGTLGAWALADAGLEIPTSYWQTTDRFWRLTQNQDGGWGYKPIGDNTRNTMAVAGIASLFVTQEHLDTDLRLIPKVDKNIDAGLAWLNKNYKPEGGLNLYYLYGIERVGLASGLKFFNNINWLQAGTRQILKAQKANGSWNYHNSDRVGTAYALLFLARGRNPVVFNKLEYDGPWNARQRDNANLTAWMSKKLERPINWQIVNLNVHPDEWLDAPILLLTGSRPLTLKDDEIAKIKSFINAGGIVFSTVDGNTAAFTDSVRKLANQVVDGKYEMRDLPNDHLLFSNRLWTNIDRAPRMMGLSNGIREVWIHSTTDMGASWHARRYAQKEHFELPANIYFYATGKASLRSRLQPLSVYVDPKAKPARTINLARLEYNGNWDPEPGAWTRMGKIAMTDFNTAVSITPTKIADLDATKTPVAHITGTARFSLTAEAADALKKFVADGGTLIADAAGRSPEFTESFTAAMKTAFPDKTLIPVNPNDPLLTGDFTDGIPLKDIAFRRFAMTSPELRDIRAPRINTIKLNDRHAVIFLPEDLTSGLLGTNTAGILGYAPDSAEKIAQNLLLYASSAAKEPPKADAEANADPKNPKKK